MLIYKIKTKTVAAGGLKQLEIKLNEELEKLRGNYIDIKIMDSYQIIIVYET
jgi:hypothetical protein